MIRIRLSLGVAGSNLCNDDHLPGGSYIENCSSEDGICSFSLSNMIELLPKVNTSPYLAYFKVDDNIHGKVGDAGANQSPA